MLEGTEKGVQQLVQHQSRYEKCCSKAKFSFLVLVNMTKNVLEELAGYIVISQVKFRNMKVLSWFYPQTLKCESSCIV